MRRLLASKRRRPSRGQRRRRALARRRKRQCLLECQRFENDVWPALRSQAQQRWAEDRVWSRYDAYGGGAWQASQHAECPYHRLRPHTYVMTYTHNPRDVNMLEWEKDGHIQGYTFL